MLELLFNRHTRGKIGSLTLDAVLSETHDYTNTVTQFPVEDGTDINDHIRNEPEQVTVTGHITNSPVKLLGLVSITGEIDRTGIEDRVQTAFEQLMLYAGVRYPSNDEAILLSKQQNAPAQKTVLFSPVIGNQVVDIVTGLRVYTNMAVEKLTVPRTPKTGQALEFTASFKKIRKVYSSSVKIPAIRVDVPHAVTQAVGKNATGAKSTTPGASAALQIGRFVKGLF